MPLVIESTAETTERKPASNHAVSFAEGPYVVRNLVSTRDLSEAHRLRHRVFCEELGWVSAATDRREVDEYDEHAVSLGALNDAGDLLACLRLIPGDGDGFMLEKEFSSLIGKGHIVRRKPDTAEVSRLCTKPEARNCTVAGNFGSQHISMVLYKGVYHWCLLNGVRFLYLVVEHRIHRLLKAKGFPCREIGEPRIMPDGVAAVAAMLDWREFEARNAVLRPEMFSWFTRYRSNRTESPRPLHEPCSPRQVFALCS